MATTKAWKEIRAARDGQPGIEERRAKARAALDAQIETYDATLADLRRAKGLTQVQLAEALEVSQAEVSRVERQADLFLSTLRSYVEAMGGELDLIAKFDDRAVVIDLKELIRASDEETTAPAARRPRPATTARKASRKTGAVRSASTARKKTTGRSTRGATAKRSASPGRG